MPRFSGPVDATNLFERARCRADALIAQQAESSSEQPRSLA
jgi:hypothetical protein